MPLNIKDEPTYALAKQVAAMTGESLTRAVHNALAEKLQRLEQDKPTAGLVDELNRIALGCAALPVIDHRSADEILDYGDDDGLPS